VLASDSLHSEWIGRIVTSPGDIESIPESHITRSEAIAAEDSQV
jgi:hypothetical protein